MKISLMIGFILLSTFLAGCLTSEDIAATHFVQTQTSQPTTTNTPLPTETPQPTNTPIPTATPLPSPSPTHTPGESVDVSDPMTILMVYLSIHPDIQKVERLEISGNVLNVEVITKYETKDLQMKISYDLIRDLADRIMQSGTSEGSVLDHIGLEEIAIQLDTISSQGDFVCRSFTSWELLQRSYEGAVSYVEWINESGAVIQNGD